MDNINIIIPMAGEGKRFCEAGYEVIKPLIPLKNGEPMIEAVVDSLQLPDANYIFVVRDSHDDEYGLKEILQDIRPGCTVVRTNGLTGGAAETILLAKPYCDKSLPVIVCNSDQLVEYNKDDFIYQIKSKMLDGSILTFESDNPKWSYVKYTKDQRITGVVEKRVVSNKATCGIYYYTNTKYMFGAIKLMMLDNYNKVNGEWYFAPSYNEFIDFGLVFTYYDVDKMIGLGTPEDLEIYMGNNDA